MGDVARSKAGFQGLLGGATSIALSFSLATALLYGSGSIPIPDISFGPSDVPGKPKYVNSGYLVVAVGLLGGAISSRFFRSGRRFPLTFFAASLLGYAAFSLATGHGQFGLRSLDTPLTVPSL